jgi:hypothetical protein
MTGIGQVPCPDEESGEGEEQEDGKCRPGGSRIAESNQQSRDPGAREAADAEEAVKRRHQRPAIGNLDSRRLVVHGDVEHSRACAEDQRGNEEERGVRREDRQ